MQSVQTEIKPRGAQDREPRDRLSIEEHEEYSIDRRLTFSMMDLLQVEPRVNNVHLLGCSQLV